VSCGKPHEVPCDEVLHKVFLFLDSECDQLSRTHIAQHLDECGPCLQYFGIEREIKCEPLLCDRKPHRLARFWLDRGLAPGHAHHHEAENQRAFNQGSYAMPARHFRVARVSDVSRIARRDKALARSV